MASPRLRATPLTGRSPDVVSGGDKAIWKRQREAGFDEESVRWRAKGLPGKLWGLTGAVGGLKPPLASPWFCPCSHQSLSKLIVSPLSLSYRNPPFLNNPKSCPISFTTRFRRFSCTSTASTPTAPLGEKDFPSLGDAIKHDFPILDQVINGKKLVYLDNAATSQKPKAVLKVLNEYYESYNSNVHRGIHFLSAKATDEYEQARRKVASFLNVLEPREIVFTRNATEAINLVAYSWGLSNLKPGDEVLLTIAEHHSAIVPWQLVAQQTGASLKYIGLTKEQVPDVDQLKKLLSKKTKLVVTHHVSNTLASVLPIDQIVLWSHDVGAKVLVDACQSVPHMAVDVQKLNADFLVASSHKMCGPTGVGFLYGKSDLLSAMPPFLGGGEMIADVFEDYSTYAEPPSRFEAGTPAIGEVIGLGAAIDYLSRIGMQKIHKYELELANYLYDSLLTIPDIHVYGPSPSETTQRAALCSFNVGKCHATDIATILDEMHGVAIRSGHHCAQPLHRWLGVNSSARASLYFYNSKNDVDFFIEALKDTINFLT